MPNNPVSFATRLPPKLHRQLKAYAITNNLSMNQTIVNALADLVDQQGPLKRIEKTVTQTDRKVDQLLDQ